jgi:hypothetical protein
MRAAAAEADANGPPGDHERSGIGHTVRAVLPPRREVIVVEVELHAPDTLALSCCSSDPRLPPE